MSHQHPTVSDPSVAATPTTDSCVESGIFVPLPSSPPTSLTLDYATVNATMNQQIQSAGRMTFHMMGCAGDPTSPQEGLCVGEGMASQIANPPANTAVPAFFYHLGDVSYKSGSSQDTTDPPDTSDPSADLSALWNTQFYTQYQSYQYPAQGATPAAPAPIFAIAGNHDAKSSKHKSKDEIGHFLTNFCGTSGTLSPDNQTGDGRTEMFQPYPYWLLETPLAYIIGLYTNDTNGGLLDDPHINHDPFTGPQFTWLVSQLTWIRQQNSAKAVLVTLHYPPFNGATNFAERGDPTLGPTKGARHAVPVGMALLQAFTQSGRLPDAVFSAHAHLYQRLTYTYDAATTPTREVPYLIVGTGGHAPTEILLSPCEKGNPSAAPVLPMNLFSQNPSIIPNGMTLPAGDAIFLEAYLDASNASPTADLPYGFLSVTITAATTSATTSSDAMLTGSYYTMAYDSNGITSTPTLRDSFTLNLTTHLLV